MRVSGGFAVAVVVGAMVFGLMGCAAPEEGSAAGPRDVAPSATSASQASADEAMKAGAASTCSALSVLVSFTGNASVEHSEKKLTDAQLAAVLHFASTAMQTIEAAPQDGLHDQIAALAKAVPPVSADGSVAKPFVEAAAYVDAMRNLQKACRAHGYKVFSFSSVSGG